MMSLRCWQSRTTFWGRMTGARWLLCIPAMWLILMYAVHTQDPVKAVVGWAIVFAPFVVAICVARCSLRIAEWRHHRR